MYAKKTLLLFTACALWISSAPASAVTFDWVTVGNPGNAADNTGFGSVADTYRISRYEVTNAQYAEFLNAKARLRREPGPKRGCRPLGSVAASIASSTTDCSRSLT